MTTIRQNYTEDSNAFKNLVKIRYASYKTLQKLPNFQNAKISQGDGPLTFATLGHNIMNQFATEI